MNFQLPDASGLPASLQSASQSASDKLLQAATLSNVAKIAIARLPEQILRISLPGTDKAPAMTIRPPSPGTLKDNAPSFMARTAVADKSTAVLLQALEQQVRQPLTPKTEAAVTQFITRLVQSQPNTTLTIPARVVSAGADTLTLKADKPANQPPVSLPVSERPVSLKPNEPVAVTIKSLPQGRFEIAVTSKNTPSMPPVTIAQNQTKAADTAVTALISAKLAQTGITVRQPQSVPVPRPLENIFAASPRSQPSAPPIDRVMTVKIEPGTKEASQLVMRQVSLQPMAKVSMPPEISQMTRLPVLTKSDLAPSALSSLPQAKVVYTPPQPGSQTPPPLPQQQAQTQLQPSSQEKPAIQAPTPSAVPSPQQTTNQSTVATKAGTQTTSPGITDSPAGQQATKVTSGASTEKPVMSPSEGQKTMLTPEAQAKVHSQIIELSRVLLKDTGSTKEALGQLIQILKSGQGNTSTPTRQTLNQLLAAVQGADPKPVKPETAPLTDSTVTNEGNKLPPANLAQQLQNLLSTPALMLTPTQLSAPAPANNLVAGLVMLLQLTLAGRAINRQPSLATSADAPEQPLQKIVQPSSGGGAPLSRISQDLASLESRSQFLNQVKTLLANHQQQKLSQADSRLQGQDSFYYVLPVTSQKGAPPEILIRPDDRGGHQGGAADARRRLWNVTMKLDVGDFGELLAKSRIDGDVIELDLYTSTDALLTRVADTLPLLKRRLTALGLEVAHSSFQRGKIPPTLNERPYHIFETQA